MDSTRRFLAYFSVVFLFSSALLADTIDRSDDLDNADHQAVREWINTKRQVTVKEIGGALSISGEVRAEFQSTNETSKGVKQRGSGGATDLNGRAYDIEVNLMLDYRADRTWGTIKIEFDNDAGVFGGTLNKLKLEKAYFGGRMIDEDTYTSDLEIGRRKLSTIVDSKLEFSAFFDGIWAKYDQGFEKFGDLFVHLGPFVVKERIDQYAWLMELGLLDVGGSGFYTKYSVIDWDTRHFSNPIERRRFRFLVSQLILGYKFYPEKLQKVIVLYLAGLYNHKARTSTRTGGKLANWGAYLGFSLGELKKKGDWSMDANYQLLAAQAVPDFDVSGIGLGNASNAGFFTPEVDSKIDAIPPPLLTTRKQAAGNGNYRGFIITVDYLITGNLTLEQQWQQSITLDDNIGPFRRFKQYEIELIYAF